MKGDVLGGFCNRTPLDIVVSGFLQVIKVACSVFKYSSSHHGSGEWVPTRLVSSIGSFST